MFLTVRDLIFALMEQDGDLPVLVVNDEHTYTVNVGVARLETEEITGIVIGKSIDMLAPCTCEKCEGRNLN